MSESKIIIKLKFLNEIDNIICSSYVKIKLFKICGKNIRIVIKLFITSYFTLKIISLKAIYIRVYAIFKKILIRFIEYLHNQR